MNRILLALRLVKVARLLVAFSRNQLETELKRKRLDLKDDKLQEHLDCLEKMDAKEQKVALYWINKNRLVLPEDLSKFKEAMNLINKQHLDFQEFEGPMEVVNKNDKSTLRIKSQDARFNPSSERTFSNPYNAGDGVIIYDVENSREGQQAVRKAIDSNWGYDKNPWCLAARNSDAEDELDYAWRMWNHYNAYPKRIAFKNGKLLAFSAGNKKQRVEWWDKNDRSHYAIPEGKAMDDIEFLKRHGRLNLLDSPNASPGMLEELSEDEDWNVRSGIAMNPSTPSEVLMKLAEDEDGDVRQGVALNSNTPVEVLKKLAEDEYGGVREQVAKNSNTPIEVLKKLAEDEYGDVRKLVANNPSTPVEILRKLAEDEDENVKFEVVMNPKTPSEVLMKLAEDEDENVKFEVTMNPSTPSEVLKKLAEDKEWGVREQVAKNSNTPSEVLRKLAEDEEWHVRYEVAGNPSTPAEALRKLAEDEDWEVREVAKHHLKQ